MLVVTQASSLIWQQRTLKIHSMIAQSEPVADSDYSGAQVKCPPPPQEKKIVLPGNSSARELISCQFRLEVNHWRKNRLKHISSLKTTATATTTTTTTTTTATTKIRKTPFDHSFVSTSSWADCLKTNLVGIIFCVERKSWIVRDKRPRLRASCSEFRRVFRHHDGLLQQPRVHQQGHRHLPEALAQMERVHLQAGLEGALHLRRPLLWTLTDL